MQSMAFSSPQAWTNCGETTLISIGARVTRYALQLKPKIITDFPEHQTFVSSVLSESWQYETLQVSGIDYLFGL